MEHANMPEKKYYKIAFIAGTLGRGGAERQLFYLTTSLVKFGYQVTVYCLTKSEYYESILKENGVSVIYFGEDKSKIKRVNRLFHLLRSEKPRLIYSFHFYTNTYAALAGKFLRIKSVGSIRNDAISEKQANGVMSWLHYSLPGCIVANSDHGAANCEKIFYSKRIFVLKNVIDTDSFPFSNKDISSAKPLQLVLVGRFEQQKRPWLFPVLIKKLSDHGLEVEGHMFGNGSYKEETKALISKDFSNYNISVNDSHPHIQEIYKKTHWLCSLSMHEGTPNVVMEAMASGVGIAALNYPGIKALIENQHTGLVEDEIENLCRTIIKYTSAGSYEKITQNAREKILREYSLSHLVDRFEELMQHI